MSNTYGEKQSFDFFKKEDLTNLSQEKKDKFKKFKHLVVGTLLIASPFVIGYAGWKIHEANKAEEVKVLIESINVQNIKEKISVEQSNLNHYYAENASINLLINKESEVVKILDMQDVAYKNIQNNDMAMKEAANKLTQIEKDIELMDNYFSLESKEKNNYLKKYDNSKLYFLTTNRLKEYQEGSISTNIMALNQIFKKDLQKITDFKKEVASIVKEKIKSKDFDLNKSKEVFTGQIEQDINSELSTLNETKKSVEEMKGHEELFSENDFKEAIKGMAEVQSLSVNKINEDQKKAEGLIKEAQTQNTKTNQWGFFEYYLLYHWMTAPSQSATSQYASANMSNAYSKLNAKPMYDIKSEKSYLNEQLKSNDKHNFKSTKDKIEKVKQKAKVANMRSQEFKMMKKNSMKSSKSSMSKRSSRGFGKKFGRR